MTKLVEFALFAVSAAMAINAVHTGDALNAACWGASAGMWFTDVARRVIYWAVARGAQ